MKPAVLTPLESEYAAGDQSGSLEMHNSACLVTMFCRRNFNVVSDKKKKKKVNGK